MGAFAAHRWASAGEAGGEGRDIAAVPLSHAKLLHTGFLRPCFTALLLNQEVAGLVTQRMEYKERGEEREVGRAADSCLNFKEKLMIHLGGGLL